jgi:hypothetical protein
MLAGSHMSVTVYRANGGNHSLVGDDRLAELERHRQAGLARLVEHLAPLTARLVDEWAPRFAAARGEPRWQRRR